MGADPETPARSVFPEYPRVPEMFARETAGLGEAQLDRRRAEKSWGQWSIREQVSHVASVPYRWLLIRWGSVLFPGGLPRGEDLVRKGFSDRMMNPARCRELGALLAAMADAFSLAWDVLGGETLGSLRARGPITERVPPGTVRGPEAEDVRAWRENVNRKAHPRGIWTPPGDPDLFHYDLEYTFRHILWEAYAHLRTVQMHKRAEGLPPAVDIPPGGYLDVLTWE